jgi:transposase
VELFEQIRREYTFGNDGDGSTVRGIARQFGVHRRTVRQAIEDALPPERKVAERAAPRLSAVQPFINAVLEADKTAPRKQRHTAHRIWVRLREEHPGLVVAESTVRQYVRERKRELGLLARDTYVPQVYLPGQEAQVDWYEAYALIGGERVKVQVFNLRSMSSGGAFHCAYLRGTQQAFLHAHELAFAYFGGVFKTLRYDNLTSAVKKVLRGHTREETTRFIAFRSHSKLWRCSHWQFAAEFCTPASPQEKGGVEGEVGYFRRNHFVPVPVAESLDALNRQILAGCRADEARIIGDRRQSVGSGMVTECAALLPLQSTGFDLAEVRPTSVDGKGCVRVQGNSYSVPLHAGTKVSVRVLPSKVSVWHSGSEVANHERHYGQGQQILELTHYLDVLRHILVMLHRKPGAFAGSRPLSQWREQGRWPGCFDTLLANLKTRHGDASGTRTMVDLLQMGTVHGQSALITAVEHHRYVMEQALKMGSSDAAVVQALLHTSHTPDRISPEPLPASLLGSLSQYERPLPDVTSYDQLLGAH